MQHETSKDSPAPMSRDTGSMEGGDGGAQPDRKVRKPLVEKKRRARINESLHELRQLIGEPELHSKLENAEVLEMTVRRVEDVLQNQAQEVDALKRENSERFAAGYIQCMHDVHTFVSSCPGMDPAIAAELLNHLLESMPLNDGLPSESTDAACSSTRPPHGKGPYSTMVSPTPSFTSADDLSSDLEETDSEQSHVSSSEETDNQHVHSGGTVCGTMWRPW